MVWNPFRASVTETAVTEVAAPAERTTPPPRGFAWGIPAGGTTEYNQGGGNTDDRRTKLESLYQAYVTCPWSSACVDTIARTITAGGIEVVPKDDSVDPEIDEPTAPPAVVKLRQLLDYVNPTEDIRQLMRGVISDLEVFGDSFTEVVWLFNEPVALYSLDAPSMNIIADEHGTITGYAQTTETGQRADFEPREVIHVSLDTPRSGLVGVSPTEKAMLPITLWLFAAATLKEVMRKGDPPSVHVDLAEGTNENEVKRWRNQYKIENLGSRNIGTPITTVGGGVVNELKTSAITEYLNTKNQARDEIVSAYGVPPSKVAIIESGNLGGGTGTSQDKTFRVNTCGPIAETVMEKFIYHLAVVGFGITDWVMRFGDIDWRDDATVDQISSARLHDGRWTLNRSRAEIGEPPVDGGDDAILVDRQGVLVWKDVAQASQALAAGAKAPVPPPTPDAAPGGSEPQTPPAPHAQAPVDAKKPGAADDAKESAQPIPSETWAEAYRRQYAAVRAEFAERGTP